MIREIGIVVPAHDEAERLPACLAAIHRAAAAPTLPRTRIVVVADSCSDGTVRVARRGGAQVVEVARCNAGAARRAGFEHLLSTSVVALDELWLATTDADSKVPPTWLTTQLRLARAGWDAVAGTVVVGDWRPGQYLLARRFARHYGPLRDDHAHVHGANLGLSATAYRRVGGFPERALAEDHALFEALTRCGAAVARTGAAPVATSGRLDPRAPGGFGSLLRTLGGAGGSPLERPAALRDEDHAGQGGQAVHPPDEGRRGAQVHLRRARRNQHEGDRRAP